MKGGGRIREEEMRRTRRSENEEERRDETKQFKKSRVVSSVVSYFHKELTFFQIRRTSTLFNVSQERVDFLSLLAKKWTW